MRNRFPVTLWLTLVALVAALALPARANTWPLPPPGSRLVADAAARCAARRAGDKPRRTAPLLLPAGQK